jgi:hypothetical protein
MIEPKLFERLSPLLGRTCLHRGRWWRLIDLLPGEGLLVLESVEQQAGIQLDQYGRASHRAPDLCQVPVLAGEGSALSEQIQTLLQNLGGDSIGDGD